MDRITEALLNEFSASFEIADLPEDERFERFATYLTVKKHYSEATFDPGELVTGGGGDNGIDGVAIIANNSLVTDSDTIDDLLDMNNYLDVEFIFVQAERSTNFEAAKIGNFCFGVRDFFGAQNAVQNEAIAQASRIMDSCFKNSSHFKRGNPTCYLYYVTTGKWQNDTNLIARYQTEEELLRDTGYFRHVEFRPVGSDSIQKLFNESKNAVTREFTFDQRSVISNINNVTEAHLGHLEAREFLNIICDENGELIRSLFYENVRDWYGYNQINDEIRQTLLGDGKDRFVLMNNGITIIAKSLFTTGHRFTMSDFHVVNGCQTSYVLYDNRKLLDESVRIPLRIIATQDEAVMETVITATNRQTEIKEDQFFALRDFAKKLEAYFKTFEPDQRIYYERRAHQYDSLDVPKTKIVTHQNLVRAVGAMFLSEPHRTTRTYRLLRDKVGKSMFRDTDCLEPYYVGALALYWLEFLFRNRRIDAIYKAARFQILLATRLLMDAEPLRPMNSHEMERRCRAMIEQLQHDADDILTRAVEVVNEATGKNLDRDYVRTQPVTNAILKAFGQAEAG